jgi:hypothetical protein
VKENSGSIEDLLYNIIKNEKDYLFKNDVNDFSIQLTSSYNQNNRIYNNESTVELGDCENTLKRIYNISSDNSLIILKVEYYKEGLLIPIIEYELFHPTERYSLILDYCNNTKISISIPLVIDENNLNVYNTTSAYYTDICYPSTSVYSTDITLEDRKKEFISKNLSLCESNCIYKGYNTFDKKVECECEAKNKFINQIDQSDMDSQLSDFSNERRITDYFLQSFIIEKANILLVVLGKMTCQDQFFLNKIKKIIKNNMYSNFTKKVIVIHNLFNFEDIKEVEDYIKDTLKKSLTFNVNEMAIKNINSNNKSNSFENYFEEIIPDAPNLKIVHLIYTEDGSEAGKYYNDSTINYIRKCIQAKADYKKFDVVQNLKDFFYGISSTIINEEINKKIMFLIMI